MIAHAPVQPALPLEPTISEVVVKAEQPAESRPALIAAIAQRTTTEILDVAPHHTRRVLGAISHGYSRLSTYDLIDIANALGVAVFIVHDACECVGVVRRVAA